METFSVIVLKPLTEPLPKLGSVAKRPQVKILMFERPPKPLNENIILNSAAAVHADGRVVLFQGVSKGLAGKLGPLVGVENLRSSIAAQRFCEGLYAEV
jgi:hypothetical protein